VFHPTEYRIIGVLDWEMSTIGHPLSDLANMLMVFKRPPPLDSANDVEGTPPLDDILRYYASLAGMPFPIPGYKFAESFALFRVRDIDKAAYCDL